MDAVQGTSDCHGNLRRSLTSISHSTSRKTVWFYPLELELYAVPRTHFLLASLPPTYTHILAQLLSSTMSYHRPAEQLSRPEPVKSGKDTETRHVIAPEPRVVAGPFPWGGVSYYRRGRSSSSLGRGFMLLSSIVFSSRAGSSYHRHLRSSPSPGRGFHITAAGGRLLI